MPPTYSRREIADAQNEGYWQQRGLAPPGNYARTYKTPEQKEEEGRQRSWEDEQRQRARDTWTQQDQDRATSIADRTQQRTERTAAVEEGARIHKAETAAALESARQVYKALGVEVPKEYDTETTIAMAGVLARKHDAEQRAAAAQRAQQESEQKEVQSAAQRDFENKLKLEQARMAREREARAAQGQEWAQYLAGLSQESEYSKRLEARTEKELKQIGEMSIIEPKTIDEQPQYVWIGGFPDYESAYQEALRRATRHMPRASGRPAYDAPVPDPFRVGTQPPPALPEMPMQGQGQAGAAAAARPGWWDPGGGGYIDPAWFDQPAAGAAPMAGQGQAPMAGQAPLAGPAPGEQPLTMDTILRLHDVADNPRLYGADAAQDARQLLEEHAAARASAGASTEDMNAADDATQP